ncbi:tyrosine-type recombinase/integrase [Phenylobacterium sp.]|uniref:tyrosine-type recombinase/integrase n=1 Tax=Phenylobacterium sp. TaxID=1871053 RepID=UPI00374DC927
MATVRLTDKAVAAARAIPNQRLELWDAVTPGLCLRVSDTGRKVFVYRYRTDDGRQPRMTLGVYSTAFGLADAREAADRVRVQVHDGEDPASERKRAKSAAKGEPIKTFDDLADAYLKACEAGEWKPRGKRQRERTISGHRAQLRLHVRPVLGKERVEAITKAQVRNLLRKMVDAGIGAQTNRIQAVVRQCFSFAISEDRVAINPATGFAKFATETPRARILSDAELKTFWGALIDPSGLRLPVRDGQEEGTPVYVGRAMRIAVQLSALLLQRRGEVAGMRLSEIDLDQGTWLIPAERMKNGFPHLVPLPPRASALIGEALDLGLAGMTDEEREKAPNDRPVFPSPRSAAKSVKPDSLTHAMVNIAAAIGIDDATPHDLRRTGSTVMTSERLGVTPFIRSKVLGHRGDTGGGSAVSMTHYDANTYAPDKRRALAAWEGLLLEIVSEAA